MNRKRNARFTGEKLEPETLVKAHSAILSTPDLPIKERLKAALLLWQAHNALCGLRIDIDLAKAAHLLGAVDRWNERVPQEAKKTNQALGMVSRHLGGVKSPDAIRVAMKRKIYRTRREACAKTISDKDAFDLVFQMVEAELWEGWAREEKAKYDVSTRHQKQTERQQVRPGMRGGSK